jgi:CheY-like chemotaxis protein
MGHKTVAVALVDCPSLRMYEQFLTRRGYEVHHVPASEATVMVVCADHVGDPVVRAAGTAFVGPKLVLGAEPPEGWVKAEKLRLPLLPLDLEQHIGRLCAGPRETVTAYTVLVVEDDSTTAASVARALGGAGFTVHTCEGFSEMARGLQNRPDFIVMDLNLPGLSGEKLGEIIRVKRIPVAVFSSEPPARLEEARQRIGAVAAFPKDTPLGVMADWIRTFLDRRGHQA